MIETIQDFQNFSEESIQCDWIVHAIPLESELHPADTSASIIFIKNLKTDKIYYYAINHPDSIPDTNIFHLFKDYWDKLTNIKWTLDSKTFYQLTGLKNTNDVNLCSYMNHNETLELSEFDLPIHRRIRSQWNGMGNINRAIPLLKHKEAFYDLSNSIERIISKFIINDPFLYINKNIDILGRLEKNGIYVDRELFNKHFDRFPNKNNLVYSQYNIYTSTGRPSNRHNGINYAALKKMDGTRSSFISRHNALGAMVVIDYSAFHPRIICDLTNYPIPNDVNIYEYLAKLYFQKKEVDETDINDAKQLTFRQLYGGVEDKFAHIKYLANLKSYIDDQWSFFSKHGYVETPLFKRRITDKHIHEPNPTKLFNYILQAVEGEISIPKIGLVLDYLENKKTKVVLYTYDAILCDFHKDDGIDTLCNLQNIMSGNNKYSIKSYIGRSYQDIKLIEM